MRNNKITSHPPKRDTPMDFILGAEKKPNNNIRVQTNYPWMESSIRDDVQKVFTVKLLEKYILKIKYISNITNKSQQKIVRDIINKGVDDLLKSMNIE